jgi:hypothetical protein
MNCIYCSALAGLETVENSQKLPFVPAIEAGGRSERNEGLEGSMVYNVVRVLSSVGKEDIPTSAVNNDPHPLASLHPDTFKQLGSEFGLYLPSILRHSGWKASKETFSVVKKLVD